MEGNSENQGIVYGPSPTLILRNHDYSSIDIDHDLKASNDIKSKLGKAEEHLYAVVPGARASALLVNFLEDRTQGKQLLTVGENFIYQLSYLATPVGTLITETFKNSDLHSSSDMNLSMNPYYSNMIQQLQL